MGEVLPEPGADLDGYTIMRELGRGGMGAVFLARKGAARYAIKVLLDLEPEQLLRFEREAQALAAVDRHPNIVTIHTLGRFRGKPYVVMDYVEGGDLRSLLKARGRLELDEALSLLSAVADAVGSIHARGIIHRDLKPENILIRAEDGAPVVTDFGLARGGDLADLTHSGFAGGTPHYMAPEQIDGSSRVGPRSDVWALGVILYELICGRRPFEGSSLLAIGRAILASEPKAIAAPIEVRNLIAGALCKSPRSRYSDARAFLSAIADSRGRERPLAWPIKLAGALLVLTLILGGYGLWLRWRAPASPAAGAGLSEALKTFDADLLSLTEALISKRLRARLPELPAGGGAAEPEERLREAYDRFKRELRSREAIEGLEAGEQSRAYILRALLDESVTNVPLALRRSRPFGPLLPRIQQLLRGEALAARIEERTEDDAVLRLVELSDILAAVEGEDWESAYLRALLYEADRKEPILGLALSQAARARNDIGPAFWERAYRQAAPEGGPFEPGLEVKALAGLAGTNSDRVFALFERSLKRRGAAERTAFIRRFQRAIQPAEGRPPPRLLRELIGFFGARKDLDPAAFEGFGAGYLAAHESYLETCQDQAEESARALQWAFQLKRMVPGAPVRFPLLDNGDFLPNGGLFPNFHEVRRAVFTIGRSATGYRLADLPFLARALVMACRYGAYVEILPQFAERLEQDDVLPPGTPTICADFLFAHVELQQMLRRERESDEALYARQQERFPQMLERVERVIDNWDLGPRPERFVAIARYKRARLLRYAVERGWVGEERRGSMVKEYIEALAAPGEPFAAVALLDLAQVDPKETIALGFDRYDRIVESLKERQVLARTYIDRAGERGDEALGPWPELLPIFASGPIETYLLLKRADLALEAGQGPECLAYFDAFERRWQRRASALYLSARQHFIAGRAAIRGRGPSERAALEKLDVDGKNVLESLEKSLGQQQRSIAVARGRLLNRMNRYAEALTATDGHQISDEGLLAEVRAEACARLGKLEQALAAARELPEGPFRLQLERQIKEVWSR